MKRNSLFITLITIAFTITALAGDAPIVYHPGTIDLFYADSPSILNKSYRIEGEVTVPEGGANGVIVADGGIFGGYSLYLQNGVPLFSYNLVMLDTIRWKGKEKVSPGHHTISFDFQYDGGGLGKGGTGTLLVDGNVVDIHRIEKTVPITMPWFEGLDIGMDLLTPVDTNYETPNPFTGTIKKVTFFLEPQLAAKERHVWLALLSRLALLRQ